MNISHLSRSDLDGGAARAAYRIHHALRKIGVESVMMVNRAIADDWTVRGPKTKVGKLATTLRSPLASLVTSTLSTGNPILHSPSIIPSRWHKRLNASNTDVVHLHWINGELVSIADIGAITKPIVWTLHDMWAFCGAEHYTDDQRWRDGYTSQNRPSHESGFDLNRWTWARKLKRWNLQMHIVTPSQWMADCARQSALMRDWPVTCIPNTIDTDLWCPVEKSLARQLLQLPDGVPLLLFGAMGGTEDPRKGFDLLQAALHHLRGSLPHLELVIFGQLPPKDQVDFGFPIHYTGHLHDDLSLRILFSAADVMVIPSRQDNLPNTGIEAHACGTPVVAFNTCGMPDIVHHKITGYLAKAFDTVDLASGLSWVLSDAARHASLRRAARERAMTFWTPEVIGAKYLSVYDSVI